MLVAAVTIVAACLLGAGPALADSSSPPPTLKTIDTVDGDARLIPLPNSGRAPQASGDRGGWAQIALFCTMTAGMVVIGLRIAHATRRRDRTRNATS